MGPYRTPAPRTIDPKAQSARPPRPRFFYSALSLLGILAFLVISSLASVCAVLITGAQTREGDEFAGDSEGPTLVPATKWLQPFRHAPELCAH
jgi:hypothetical protein